MKTDSEQLFPRPLSGETVVELPPALLPQRTTLKGHLVSLEPQDSSRHAQELYQAGHGSEEATKLWDYMPYGPWDSVDAYAATLRQQSATCDPIFFTIRSHESGKACGQASYLDIQAQNGAIEIGHIWFAPELQRTRAATEVIFLMLKYAMNDLKYRRMQWKCNALNEKSRRAANRFGFRFEGISYNHLIFKGKNRDTAWYSILDDEWPEVRGIMNEWLSDGNFDSENSAKTSLSECMQKRSPSTRGS